MNKINCSNCFTLINKSGIKKHQISNKCTKFVAVELPQINAVSEIININAEIQINSENWNEIINEVQKGTCYVCMIDDLKIVETCGILSHYICLPCRKQVVKCPMCRVDIPQSKKTYEDYPRVLNDNRFLIVMYLIRSISENTASEQYGEQLINDHAQIVENSFHSWYRSVQNYSQHDIIRSGLRYIKNYKRRHPTFVPTVENTQDDFEFEFEDIYDALKELFKNYNVSFTLQSIIDVCLVHFNLLF